MFVEEKGAVNQNLSLSHMKHLLAPGDVTTKQKWEPL